MSRKDQRLSRHHLKGVLAVNAHGASLGEDTHFLCSTALGLVMYHYKTGRQEKRLNAKFFDFL